MGVKSLLAKQKEDFMGLHEVLCRMGATDNSSYEEAAQALAQALRTASSDGPVWYEKLPTHPKSALEDAPIKIAYLCLEQASIHGIPPECPGNDYIEMREYDEFYGDMKHLFFYEKYGFDRAEIISFLKSLGLEIERVDFPTAVSTIRSPQPLTASANDVCRDLGFSEQLSKCLNENETLRREAEENKILRDEISKLNKELTKMAQELEEKTRIIGKLTADRDRLNGEVVRGKSKKSALRLIGGLAIKGYELDIHASKIAGVADLSLHLNAIGAFVCAETISDWLKEAAQEIPDPKPRKS